VARVKTEGGSTAEPSADISVILEQLLFPFACVFLELGHPVFLRIPCFAYPRLLLTGRSDGELTAVVIAVALLDLLQ
jgi:hypothetical protein